MQRQLQADARFSEATLKAMTSLAMLNDAKPEEIAYQYLNNLDNSLSTNDYEKFMQNLCKNNGLQYRSDDGYVLAKDVRVELAHRLSQIMQNVHTHTQS